jgi:CheY-like chemotaxis protein
MSQTLNCTLASRVALFGKMILIVEDEPLVALDLHAALSAAGAGVIAASDTTEALRLLRRNQVSAAVLDLRLGDRYCIAVCQALLHHGIPFVFCTGFPDAQALQDWPEIPVLRKPVVRDTLVSTLAGMVR